MSEYKFRAFYKPLKKMIQPEQLESINFDTKIVGVYMPHEGRGYHKFRLSDFVLMQYTGVHDDTDNQVELYDGDIVEVEYEGRKHICEVQYCGSGYMFVADSLPDGYLWFSYFIEFDSKYCWAEGTKKLGDIYTNPELLGG